MYFLLPYMQMKKIISPADFRQFFLTIKNQGTAEFLKKCNQSWVNRGV